MSLCLSRRAMRMMRVAARASSLLACAIFAALAIQRGPPAPPEGSGIERDVQYAFVLVGMLATLAAWRFPGLGGALLALTGVVLGVAAATRYSPATSLFVALMFVTPGVLFVALWSSGRALIVQAGAAAFIVLLLALGGREAQSRHEAAFGPAHPSSPLETMPIDRVLWVWAGATTSTGFEIRAKVTHSSDKVRLVVSRSPDLANAVYSDFATAASDANRVASPGIDGLEPLTTYYYGVEVDGTLDEYQRGEIKTFPNGAASFTIAFAACARSGSNGAVYDAIRTAEPLLYVVTGDLHYENIDTNDLRKFRSAYDRVLTSPAQSALYRRTSIAYTWDDHDYGGNNSDSTSRSRTTARLSYRETVPHYDLPAGAGNDAIYQAFSVGRVRFILTDTRSERNAESAPGGGKSMLGSRQLTWLKQELLAASRSHSLVVWVNPDPWISSGDLGGDDWGAFASERRDIADFIATNGIRNLVMLSGDAHMIAADDGSNSDYSSGGGAGFPVFHAAALDRPGSVKCGPYSEGTFAGAGQFGLLSVEDDGKGPVSVTFRGMDYASRELVSYTFTVPAPAAAVAP